MEKNRDQVKSAFKKLFQKDALTWIRWGFVSTAILTPIYVIVTREIRSSGRSFSAADIPSLLSTYVLIPLIFLLAALGIFEFFSLKHLFFINKLCPIKIAKSHIFQFFFGAVSWVLLLTFSLLFYIFLMVILGEKLFGWFI